MTGHVTIIFIVFTTLSRGARLPDTSSCRLLEERAVTFASQVFQAGRAKHQTDLFIHRGSIIRIKNV